MDVRRHTKEWATPFGFPEWVRVSNDGRVVLLARQVIRCNGVKQSFAESELKKKLDRGYELVQFRVNGEHRAHRVHRLVWLAHGEGNPAGLDINHKNGRKNDNRIENLEICTRSENHRHAYRALGRVSPMKGKASPKRGVYNDPRISKTVVGVPVCGGPEVRFASVREAGRQGFSRDSIAKCLTGEQRTANGYWWRYE